MVKVSVSPYSHKKRNDMDNKYRSISIVIATYNSSRTLERCLKSIRSQLYPQEMIEIIIADGGSKDDTLKIGEKYGAHILHVDYKKQNAELNKSLGIQKAKSEILALIDHDNILPHPRWLKKMIQPFIEKKEVVALETLRYHYDSNSTLIDRYFALFGAGDPLVWYMRKSDRLSYITDEYKLAGHVLSELPNYYVVNFHASDIPTLGANGFMVRRSILIKHAKAAPGQYFDMDVNVDLISNGFTKYAFVKDSILHLTGYGNIWNFLKRRLLFISQYRFGKKGERLKKIRRYGKLTGLDKIKLIYAIIVCTTFVIPLYDSIRGWKKIHDSAWFLHPFLCFSFVLIYSWSIMRNQFHIYAKKILGR